MLFLIDTINIPYAAQTCFYKIRVLFLNLSCLPNLLEREKQKHNTETEAKKVLKFVSFVVSGEN